MIFFRYTMLLMAGLNIWVGAGPSWSSMNLAIAVILVAQYLKGE